MKLAPEKLPLILKQALFGFYFFSGQDTFLVNELSETLIDSAKKQGFSDFSRFYIDSSASFEAIYTAFYTPSLFSPKIALIIQLHQWKLDEEIKTLFTTLAQSKHKHIIAIIKGPKLERAISNTKWFQTMTQDAAWIDLPPLFPSKLPYWLQQRAKQYGFNLSPSQAEFIAQRTENNLPAAAQGIEKLALINTPITNEIIEDVIETSAEYDVFKLIDACLSKNSERIYRIFCYLKNNQLEPILIIGALAREVRLLAELIQAKQENKILKTKAQELGIWESRLPLLQSFIQNNKQENCSNILAHLAQCDAIAKGVIHGDIWHELLIICMKIGGIMK